MAAIEQIIFQQYVWRKSGKRTILEPGSVVVCRDTEDALRRIEKVRDGQISVAGAQVVRMSVDEEAGDYGEPEILGRVGDVPQEAEV